MKMITVNHVLKTEPFENAIILAGKSGLSNEVKTTTIAELLDAANWLRGGEIVCTTGYLVRNLPADNMITWVDSLIKNEAAALAVKTTRFLGDIPESVKLHANANNFPIISLPEDVTWPNIIEAVVNLNNDKNVKQLQRMKEINERLTNHVLNDSGIQKLTETLADSIGCPIIIEDAVLNPMATAIPSSFEDQSNFKAISLMEVRLNKDFTKTIINSPYYRHVVSKKKKELTQIPLHNNRFNTFTIPILASNLVYGFLTLLDMKNELLPTDMMTLEHGANTIALQLVKDSVVNNKRHESELEQVQMMINGQFTSSELAVNNLSFPSIIILIESNLETKNEELYIIKQPKNHFEEIIKESFRDHIGDSIIVYEKNTFIVLAELRDKDKSERITQIQRILNICKSKLNERFPSNKINIALGSECYSKEDFKKSYEHAKETLRYTQSGFSINDITRFEHIGIHRLIQKIDDLYFLRSIRDDYLSHLIAHDMENNDTLCDTLHQYLKVGGNVTHTAKKLFVHPNTVLYRLRKIKSIIGNPLEDYLYRDSLLIALEINNYLDSLNSNQ